MRSAKKQAVIIIYDIETIPNISLSWGIYDQNIPKVVQQGYVMGFAWKELAKRKVHSCYIWDYDLYSTAPTDDSLVTKKWIEVMNNSDIVIGHNSKSFDNKVMMAAVMRHNLVPPLPFENFDTLRSMRSIAKFNSNKLDDLGDYLGIGRKKSTGGIDLWWKCMTGDMSAQNKMVQYNKQDVVLTEKLYLRELPYAPSHPAINVLNSDPYACPKCGGNNIRKGMKYRATNTNLYQYNRCMDCGTPVKSRIAEYKQSEERMKYT